MAAETNRHRCELNVLMGSRAMERQVPYLRDGRCCTRLPPDNAKRVLTRGTLALISVLIGHGDVAAAGAQKPSSISPFLYSLEVVAFNVIRASDDLWHL
jgi:hypothetical protein